MPLGDRDEYSRPSSDGAYVPVGERNNQKASNKIAVKCTPVYNHVKCLNQKTEQITGPICVQETLFIYLFFLQVNQL